MRVAIIGGGASGMVCAIEIRRLSPDSKVTLYEANPRVGKKILATGNGRCNLTNMSAHKQGYRNMEFAGYALEKFTPESNIAFFNSLGLFTRVDDCGRVYPLSNQASGVLDILRLGLERYNVKVITDSHIDEVKRAEGAFVICGKSYDALVLATGGKASPAQGSDGSGYALLRNMGHSITKLSPSLVQLETDNKVYTKQLKGIRCECRLRLFIDNKIVADKDGELLFADYGLSGIVSMELSPYVSHHLVTGGTKPVVSVDFVPSMDIDILGKNIRSVCASCGSMRAADMLSGFMPGKIGAVILKEAKIPYETLLSELKEAQIKLILRLIKSFSFVICGTRGYNFAQVTRGGADTSEFNAKTMESLKIPDLYCIGELMDVDGDCGGYNLNWAWSSGRLAAKSITENNGEIC